MSIIYDALKKMESQKKSGKPQANPSGEPPQEQDSPKRQILSLADFKENRTLKLLGVFVVVLVAFLFTYKNQIVSLFSPAGRRVALSKSRQILGFGGDVSRKKAKPKVYKGYLLEGVMYDEQNPSVIINGKLLREADKIDSYIVTEISQDSVQLTNQKDNKTLILYLSL